MAAANCLGGLAQRRIAGGLCGQRGGLVQRHAILDQQLEDLDEDGRPRKSQHAAQPRNPSKDPSRADALRHGRALRPQPPQPGQHQQDHGAQRSPNPGRLAETGNRPEPLAAGEVQIPGTNGKPPAPASRPRRRTGPRPAGTRAEDRSARARRSAASGPDAAASRPAIPGPRANAPPQSPPRPPRGKVAAGSPWARPARRSTTRRGRSARRVAWRTGPSGPAGLRPGSADRDPTARPREPGPRSHRSAR